MKMICQIFFVIMIVFPSNGIPIYEIEPRSWQDNKDARLPPIISAPCTPNGRCWGWLSRLNTGTIGPRDNDDYGLMNEDSNVAVFSRISLVLLIVTTWGLILNEGFRSNPNGEQDLSSWGGNLPSFEAGTEIRSASPVIRQISSKPVKKDVFMSRSWGAGGMPFSVLYMNPHGTRPNHPPTSDSPRTTSESPKKSLEPVASSTPKNGNSRISPRNGASQQRRQYSIIPQLFISYGWGPFGK